MTAVRQPEPESELLESLRRCRELDPARVAIEVLKQRRRSAVYRVRFQEGPAWIGKRADRAVAEHELKVYAEVLPGLGVPAPRLYGSVERREGTWLFLEDLGTRRFELGEPGQRQAAARWLAAVHVRSAAAPGLTKLRDRGPGYARELLESLIERIRKAAASAPFTEALANDLSSLRERWAESTAVAAEVPITLIHADLKASNVLIREDCGALQAIPVDWEMSGRGCPGVDLAQGVVGSISPDLKTYHAAIAPAWPSLSEERLTRLCRVGALQRLVQALSWECLADPADGFSAGAQSRIEGYRRELQECLGASSHELLGASW